jgi:hypothetical protein
LEIEKIAGLVENIAEAVAPFFQIRIQVILIVKQT